MIEHLLLPKYIELETSTLCNRKCQWCPNSIYKRSIIQKYINSTLLEKIVGELSLLNYQGQIALHNYNEPLLDKNIFKIISLIKKKIPKAYLIIYTNGDYLDDLLLDKLANNGVEEITISLHDAILDNSYRSLIKKIQKRINYCSKLTDISDTLGMKFFSSYKGTKIVYYVPNINMMTSRGGVIKNYNKMSAKGFFCYLPFASCAVDYEGNLKICCEVYPASNIHRKYGIVGSLKKKSFFNLWFSDSYNAFRRNILYGLNNNVICKYCPGYNIAIDEKRMIKWRELLIKNADE